MTDRYALFGNPVGHSKSPDIHTRFALETGQDLTYEAIEAPEGGFSDALAAFLAQGGKGCNVTVPFKLDAFAAADEALPAAALVGASNCLKLDDGRLLAENFDGVGLLNDIQRNLGIPLADKRILLLGAGGATRGVALPFLNAGPTEIVVANRTAQKAQDLATALAGRGPIRGCGLEDLADLAFDVVVNGTSASLTAEPLPLPDTVFAPDGLAYEMVYGKGLTPFLTQARAAGATQIADGVGMLVEQAAESFLWWRGVRPQTEAIINEMTVPLV